MASSLKHAVTATTTSSSISATAAALCEQADYFIVVGTSMNVYPAAGLIHYVPRTSPCYLVDPKAVPISRPITIFQEKAGTGVKKVVDELMSI